MQRLSEVVPSPRSFPPSSTSLFSRILSASLLCLFCAAFLSAAEYSGEINEIKGAVDVQKSGKAQWFKAIGGIPVQQNDKIRTAAGSSCTVELDDGSLVYIDENTQTSVEILEITGDKHSSSFTLALGRIFANIAKNKKTKMQVKTPVAVASVRGTEFAVEMSTDGSHFGVFEGTVAVTGAGEGAAGQEDAVSKDEVTVKADEETSVAPGKKPEMPKQLQEVMLRYKARNEALRGRIQALRERLARVPPAEREQVRKAALDRFLALKEEREGLREKLKQRKEGLRRQRAQ